MIQNPWASRAALSAAQNHMWSVISKLTSEIQNTFRSHSTFKVQLFPSPPDIPIGNKKEGWDN